MSKILGSVSGCLAPSVVRALVTILAPAGQAAGITVIFGGIEEGILSA